MTMPAVPVPVGWLVRQVRRLLYKRLNGFNQ